MDRTTIEIKYEKCRAEIVSAANGILKNAAVAEDIADEQILRLLLHQVEMPALKTAARNQSLNYVTRARRCQTLPPAALDSLASEVVSPAIALVAKEEREIIRRSLASLSVGDSRLIRLRFYEGWSFRQIGTALRIQEGTARVRLFRALRRLAILLARSGVTPSR